MDLGKHRCPDCGHEFMAKFQLRQQVMGKGFAEVADMGEPNVAWAKQAGGSMYVFCPKCDYEFALSSESALH